jgi:hypothetical protein
VCSAAADILSGTAAQSASGFYFVLTGRGASGKQQRLKASSEKRRLYKIKAEFFSSARAAHGNHARHDRCFT